MDHLCGNKPMTQRINYTPPNHMSLHRYHKNLIQYIEEAEWLGKDMSAFNDELTDVKYRLQRGDKWQALF